jgi:fructose-bisphosphate aldolase class II
MPLTLRQIRKNCEDARAAFARAREEHFALGAFNLDNQETLIAVSKAAANKKSPVLVEVSKGEVDALGLDNIRDMVENYKFHYGIEMYVNLDHSPTVEDAIAGIEAGFECIHIDISQANHEASDEEIIDKTKQVVQAAKLTGALVEAEPHYFGGSSNVHEEQINYEEMLDLELLQRIRDAIGCNISLHGGSDTPAHYFIEAVKIGVTKININSDMRYAYRQTLEKVLADNKTEYAVVKLTGQVIDEVQKVVESKIDTFNSAGKAQP